MNNKFLKNYHEIGKFYKSTGFKGIIRAEIQEIYLPTFKKCQFIFIDYSGQKLPLFLKEASYFDGFIEIEFEEFDSKEKIFFLHNKAIYVLENQVLPINKVKTNPDPNSIFRFTNWDIFDINSNTRAKIVDIIQSEYSIHFLVEKKLSQKHLIPFDSSFCLKIDEKQKTIKMKLPVGLFDITF